MRAIVTYENAGSPFCELRCEDKIKVLRGLAKEKRKVYGGVIEPAKGLEDKYNKICKCISQCSRKELDIIEVQLKQNTKSLGNLKKFKEYMITLLFSVIGVIIAASQLIAAKSDQYVVDTHGVPVFFLVVSLVIVFLCYIIDRRANSGIMENDFVLEIIKMNKLKHMNIVKQSKFRRG